MIVPDKLSREMGKRGGRDYVRELVRQRDGRKCQKCSKQWHEGMRRFDVHHVDECGSKSKAYDRVEDMDKMITYCHACHMALESTTRKVSDKTGMFKHSKEREQHPFYRTKFSTG